MAEFVDTELEELFKKWSLMSPHYEIGQNLPVIPPQVENVEGPTADKTIWIDLTKEEIIRSQVLLHNVAHDLNVFTSICKSKLSDAEVSLFEEKFPETCVSLIKTLMERHRESCLGPRENEPKITGTSGSSGTLLLSASLSDFMKLNSNPELFAQAIAKLHNCGLQFCPLKGVPEDEVEFYRSDSEMTCYAGFANPDFPISGGRDSSVVPWEVSYDPAPEEPIQEEMIEEDYLAKGARPKKLRSRQWRKRSFKR